MFADDTGIADRRLSSFLRVPAYRYHEDIRPAKSFWR